jgi:hypothetical protein
MEARAAPPATAGNLHGLDLSGAPSVRPTDGLTVWLQMQRDLQPDGCVLRSAAPRHRIATSCLNRIAAVFDDFFEANLVNTLISHRFSPENSGR